MSAESRPDDVGAKKLSSGPDSWPMPPRDPRFRFGLRALMLLVFGAALIFWVVVIGGVLVVTGSLILLGACVVGAALIIARRRSTQQDALLWVLAIAAERDMPLEPAVEAFSEQCGGGYRYKMRALAHFLAQGKSLPDALREVPGALPGEAEVLARVGWESGTLAGALREAAQTGSGLRPRWAVLSGRLTYLFGVIVVMQVLCAFVMYFIVPKFEAIFKDFGVSLPSVTTAAIVVSHFFVHYGLIFLPLFFLELMLLIAWPGMLLVRPYFERGLRFPFLVWLILLTVFIGPTLTLLLAYFVWSIGDRFVFARRHSAVILRSLAWIVEGGKPLPSGLELLAQTYPRYWVQQRLERVAADVALGEDWIAALGRSRLISASDAAVLESARRVGNLPWALRETAEGGERRLSYRLQWFINMMFPIFVLCLGTLVALFAVAYFAPLVTLISRLAG